MTAAETSKRGGECCTVCGLDLGTGPYRYVDDHKRAHVQCDGFDHCSVCGQPFGAEPWAVTPDGRVHRQCVGRGTRGTRGTVSTKDAWRLLPMEAMHDVLGVLMVGAEKYGPEDWRSRPGIYDESWEAAMRHLQRLRMGEELDGESGIHHAAHVVCRGLFMLVEYQKRNGGR